ncbi:MAG: SRPBCC family protein [Imperialibacter sp.]|uniref:SRPBCC family protein n=1 Tax=Imperialibacter sp. TaxID=2038411 RepID=UPI0032ED764D
MKSINQKAPVKCRKEIVINASQEKVWQVLTSINDWSGWNSEISKATINGSLKAGTTFDWKTGGTKIHSTLHTVNCERELGWTGKVMGIFAIHNWELQAAGQTTKVVVEESMEGLLASLLSGFFNKTLEKGMVSWLEAMKRECE